MSVIVLQYALSPGGVLKLSSSQSKAHRHSQPNGSSLNSWSIATHQGPPKPLSIASFFLDGLELASSIRGIGWQFGSGTGLKLPQEWKDTSNKRKFVFQTLLFLLGRLLLADALATSLHELSPDIWAPGNSIFGRGRTLLESWLISTAIHCAAGLVIICRMFHPAFQVGFF
jgi:hypothetical protein